jgi:hypothetical protein
MHGKKCSLRMISKVRFRIGLCDQLTVQCAISFEAAVALNFVNAKAAAASVVAHIVVVLQGVTK